MKNLLLISLTCLAVFAHAQDTPDSTSLSLNLDQVVVSATRSSSTIAQLPINVGVLNEIQLLESQAMTPVEGLMYIPGVIKQSDGGLTSTPIIRGLSRERAPILIDGNSFVGGRIRTYSLIDPFQIERVEVIKGPASAFWGSDAVGGLVNVITRKAENGYGKDFKMGASVYGGYQSVNNFLRGRVELEGRGNGFDFLIGGGGRQADNTQTPEGEIENSQFNSVNFDFNIGFSPSENQRLELSGKYFKNDDTGFPGGLGAPGPPRIIRRFAPDQQTGINFSYRANDLNGRIENIGVNAYYKLQDLHIDQFTNVFFPGTQNVNREIHPMLDVDVNFGGIKAFVDIRQTEKAKLTAGVDFLNEHRIGTFRDLTIKIFNPMGVQVNEINNPFTQIQPDSYSNSLGLFLVEEWQASDQLTILAALRYDNVSTRINDEPFGIAPIESIYNEENKSDSDNAVSGNLGIKYRPVEGLSLTANLANSFRGTDLFSKYHFTAVGQGFLIPNPDLDPERGVFYELGAAYANPKFKGEINFFQNYLNNLFVPTDITFNNTPSIQNQNIGEATITGLEWKFDVAIGRLSQVFYQGSFVQGDNDITDGNLPFMPATHQLIGINLRDKTDRMFVRLDTWIVSEQTRIAPNEIETPGYTVINLNAGLNVHNLIDKFPYTKLTVGVGNLTDKAYRSHVSRGAPGNQNTFLEPGRSINVGMVMRFGAAVH